MRANIYWLTKPRKGTSNLANFIALNSYYHDEKASQYMGQYLNYLNIDLEIFQENINQYLYPNNKNKITLNKNNFYDEDKGI